MWKGLVMGGEMTKIVQSSISTNTKKFSFGNAMGWFNIIFGLRKINLVIGLKMKAKMRRNIEWVV
jgi:hypothetical protein